LAQVKRALGAFSSKECQFLAQQALAMESGVEVLHIVAQAFIDKDLNLLVPPNLRESI